MQFNRPVTGRSKPIFLQLSASNLVFHMISHCIPLVFTPSVINYLEKSAISLRLKPSAEGYNPKMEKPGLSRVKKSKV
jgi:hypothetical protein